MRGLAKLDLSLEQLTQALRLPAGARIYATQPAVTGDGALTVFIMDIDLPQRSEDGGIPTVRYEDGQLVLEVRGDQ